MPGGRASLNEACEVLETLLRGSTRRDIIDSLPADHPAESLRRLRSMMRSHTFRAASETVALEAPVRKLEDRTRQDGFWVLHNWDHNAHEFTKDIVPVLMLDYFERTGGEDAAKRVQLEILLDYYFLHLLALCAMRIFDADDADVMLDRVTGLVGDLQGAEGSGHHFLANAETLIIYALSQFHPDEHAYDRFVDKVLTLTDAHQTRFAMPSASVLSAHLRWGFWLMYDRDVLRMRNDNVADYPWLLNSVVTLMREYARLYDAGVRDGHRADVVEALLQGLAADPWAFSGKPPPALSEYEGRYTELRTLLGSHGEELLAELEEHRPSKESYSPLSLHFNFPHNTLVATVTIALLEGEPRQLPLNALFRRDYASRDDAPLEDEIETGQEDFARALMAYSGGSPDRLGFQGAMLVAYDPYSGLRSFTMTKDAIRKSLA